ncbi:hypothetical protein MKX01_028781, partial [Papaver californicum]
DKATGEYVACKCISKTSSAYVANSVKLEIETMRKLQAYPEVVGLKQVYEDDKHVDIVMEYCHGGDLFTRLNKNRFTERNAKILFKKLMEVVKLCHDRDIVHRDIKPENIFLTTEDKCPDIKLGDFGFATCIQPGEKLHEKYGTKYYIAPEMLYEDLSYDQAVDVWSAGVVLYVLLSGGTLPFNADNDLATLQMVRDGADRDLVTLKLVRDGNLRFNPSRIWDDYISPSARDLVTQILCKDPAKRLTAAQVLNHSWMRTTHKEHTNCCVTM